MSVADEEAMKITRAAFWPGKKQAACLYYMYIRSSYPICIKRA